MDKKNATAIIVEKDRDTCSVLVRMLSEIGCNVLVFDDMVAAKKSLRKCSTPGIILYDPLSGLSDPRFPKTLKKCNSFIEIAVIADRSDRKQALKALRYGAGDYFIRPVRDTEAVRQGLKRLLGRSRSLKDHPDPCCHDSDQSQETGEFIVPGMYCMENDKNQSSMADSTDLKSESEHWKLIADVGHDLRTPLTTIQGYIEMLLQGNVPEENRECYLQRIMGQCQRLKRLTWDVSQMARQYENRISAAVSMIDADQLFIGAAEEMRLLFDLSDVSLKYRVEPGLEKICGDRDRLIQVLTNLLSNALKYSPPKSTVLMEASAWSGGGTHISVSDEGEGIPEEHRTIIFTRYCSVDVHRRGEGIGLSICNDIIRAHGGKIWVDESSSGGARFNFLIPADSFEKYCSQDSKKAENYDPDLKN